MEVVSMKLLRVLLIGLVVAIANTAPAKLMAQAAPAPPDTIILKGPTQGAVTFMHKKHGALTECVTCHHASKPEKAKTSDHQKCTECHTKPAAAPMKTALRDAFHNPMAKQGVCADCHSKAAAEGKTVPVKCADCHKKEAS
jgi:cytochrome c553